MFDTIVLPSDGSECARGATAHAAALARHYGATVHVLAVVEATPDDPTVTETHRDRAAERWIDPVRDELSAADVETASSVAEGIPAEEILSAADSLEADLLVMGTHGRSGLRRHVLGSVTERVLRSSDLPVLTVPLVADQAETHGYDDILLPTDGSEGATAGTPLAFDLAGTFDATLHGLSVVDTSPVASDVRAGALLAEFESLAEEAVADLESAAADAGLDRIETAVLRGKPHEVVTDYVDANDVDLVVMGTHGRSGLDRYLLGSVTENVIRTADVPVLAIRAGETGEH